MTASEPVTMLVGRYRLLDLVGEGGMGVVWRAHDRTLGRDVAIKLLRPIVASDEQQRRRFEREARTLAGLANEHIVRVHDYVDDGVQAFLVMEYVDGRNLADTTFARLPLDVGEAAWYAACSRRGAGLRAREECRASRSDPGQHPCCAGVGPGGDY